MRNSRMLLLAALIIFIASCKKEETTNSVPFYGTYSSMDTIYQMLGVPSKYVSIDAGTGGSFYGNSGTQYIFPANCFIDSSGADVTGQVQIEVVEYLKKGDMIFSKMLPISDDQPLMSAGEIYVMARQSGKEVFLKPGNQFRANIPQGGPADPAMELFIGRQYPSTGPAVNVANVNWINKNSFDSGRSAAIIVSGDTVSILGDSLKYYNGDHYLTGVPTTFANSLTITSGSGSIGSLTNFKSFVLVDGKKSLWPIFSGTNPVTNFLTINQPCHIIVFGLIDKKFYAGVTAINANTDAGVQNTFSLFLNEADPVAFKNQLNSLY